MSVCEACPFNAMLEASEHLVANTAEFTSDSAKPKALGGIALTKSCLKAVAEKITCPQPLEPNQNTGQLECPLQSAAQSARALSFGVWNQAQYTAPLENAQQTTSPEINETVASTGQYL